MDLGFKVDGLLRQYGCRPGVGDGWDRTGATRELRYWHDQGFAVVEFTADIHSSTGLFFQFSPSEWRTIRSVIEECGLRCHSVLGWRRMICREPWIDEKWQDLQKIADVSAILGLKIIDMMVAYPVTGPAGGAPTRPRFRSLWDATERDFVLSAEKLKPYARQIAGFGASLSLEMHEDTLHDTAVSALRLLKMIDEPNVGLNPDTLDNGWLFPGEAVADAISQAKQVAPFANHWHVKQFERALVDGVWRMSGAHADDGAQPIGEIARILVHAGYPGVAVQECGRGADGAHNMKRFRDYFRWLLDDYIPGVPPRP